MFMNKNLIKYYFGVFLVILSGIFVLGGIGLLIWLGVGQFQAQMAYDGQYIQWRIIQDVSLWGYLGIPILIIGVILFPIGCNLQ